MYFVFLALDEKNKNSGKSLCIYTFEIIYFKKMLKEKFDFVFNVIKYPLKRGFQRLCTLFRDKFK